MVIIGLTDLHGNGDYIEMIAGELTEADLVVIAGDITNFGGWNEAQSLLEHVGQYNSNILAVAGNCDKSGVSECLAERQILLNCNCVEFENTTFVGVGGSLPCPGHTPNECPDGNFAACLEQLEAQIPPGRPVVFVSHQPPAQTAVDLVGGRHTGSVAIRDFIIRNQPVLAISGHIHEAIGTDKISATILVNPGPFRHGRYARIELAEKGPKITLCDVS